MTDQTDADTYATSLFRAQAAIIEQDHADLLVLAQQLPHDLRDATIRAAGEQLRADLDDAWRTALDIADGGMVRVPLGDGNTGPGGPLL